MLASQIELLKEQVNIEFASLENASTRRTDIRLVKAIQIRLRELEARIMDLQIKLNALG